MDKNGRLRGLWQNRAPGTKSVHGFVFSIDALLASITMGIFLIALLYLSSQTSENHITAIELQKQSGDALAVLDSGGLLGSANETLINGTLAQLLPTSEKWNIDIQYYNYSDGFAPAGNLSFGAGGENASFAQVGQREFVSFENNSVKNYGVARLRIWTG